MPTAHTNDSMANASIFTSFRTSSTRSATSGRSWSSIVGARPLISISSENARRMMCMFKAKAT